MNPRGALRGNGLLACLSVSWLAVCCAYLATTRHPFTPDSFAYVAAAESIRASGTLTVPFAPSTAEALPVPYATWPPGLPLLIALTAGSGMDCWLAARLVSAAGLAAGLIWMAWLGRTREHGGAAVALVAVTLSSAVVGSSAWSEGPFLVSVCAAVWAMYRGQQPEGSFWIWLAAAALAIACATMLRYAGVFLLPVLIWHVWRQPTWMYRWAGTAMTLLAASPLLLWLHRNATLAENWRGGTAPAASLFRGAAEFCAATGSLCVPPLALYSTPFWQAVAGFIILAVTAVLAFRRRAALRACRLSLIAGACAAGLAAAPLAGRVLGQSGVVDARLIWPALAIGSLAVMCVWQPTAERRRRVAGIVLGSYALLHAFSVYALPGASPRLDAIASEASPLGADTSRAPVLSNRGWLAWRNTGRPAFYPPRAFHSPQTLAPDTLLSWAGRRGVTEVLWYDEGLSPGHEESVYGSLARVIRSRDTTLLKPRWTALHVQVFVFQKGP